jgi:hypothetical protein
MKRIPLSAITMRLPQLKAVIAALIAATSSTVITDNPALAANKTFDFVIVGAGLAGITVGNKVLCIPPLRAYIVC